MRRLMGYSATAEPVEDLRPSARFFMEVDGIALTGGCALNVLANQRIYDWATNISGPAVDVYVPPAPNDSGLTLGATWSIAPPKVRQQLQRLSSLGGIEYLADLLAGGDPWLRQRNSSAEKPIIAVVRGGAVGPGGAVGRQEFGPRALGHRSLLAVPDSQKMRQRMNRLKARQWYRPVAPMIAEDAEIRMVSTVPAQDHGAQSAAGDAAALPRVVALGWHGPASVRGPRRRTLDPRLADGRGEANGFSVLANELRNEDLQRKVKREEFVESVRKCVAENVDENVEKNLEEQRIKIFGRTYG
eukprot:Skav206119  [mRNA]  locus=scaffold172:161075:166366:+ [translate_table: standard]